MNVIAGERRQLAAPPANPDREEDEYGNANSVPIIREK
jgi:hypothetical protein